MDLCIRIAGEAGQGVQTTGNLLVGALSGMGLHVVATQSYMSRIRGGLNWFDVRIGDAELWAGREKADLLVALTDTALQTLGGDLAPNAVALHDGAAGDDVIGIRLAQIAKETGGSPVMANTVAAGAVYAVLGYDVDGLCRYLAGQFEKKGGEVAEENVRCARKGAEAAAQYARRLPGPPAGSAPAYLIDGASAIGLAAATAGVKLVSAYPMTPGTATFTYLAAAADRFGIVVEQAEDEIAAVNMICGATYAGIPAMATTSGGGFALMVEGLSLAGMMELPIFLVVAQRPGPATGLPTRTAQQDLRFAISAGHGELPRAVYAPGTVRQCFDLTRVALETAHKYQTPTILLTDQFLQDLRKNIDPLDERPRPIDRRLAAEAGGDYVRYAVTESGVSPRAIPGGDAFVVCDSDEHNGAGHITEDLNAHVAQQDKRMRKRQGMTAEALPPEPYGPDGAETLLICWGSTCGPCREAVDALNAGGGSAGMLHFAQVHPLNVEAARDAIGPRRRVCCVEGNATGQFASILREAGLVGECELVVRYDGLPFTGEHIVSKIEQ